MVIHRFKFPHRPLTYHLAVNPCSRCFILSAIIRSHSSMSDMWHTIPTTFHGCCWSSWSVSLSIQLIPQIRPSKQDHTTDEYDRFYKMRDLPIATLTLPCHDASTSLVASWVGHLVERIPCAQSSLNFASPDIGLWWKRGGLVQNRKLASERQTGIIYMQERIESEQLTLYMVRSTYRGEIVRRHRSTYSRFPSILLLKYFEIFLFLF